MSGNPYLFAVELTECEPEIRKYCLYSLSNSKCNDNLSSCPYPTKVNPLCFCKNPSNCPRFYNTITKEGKTYIFYKCGSCNSMLTSIGEEISKVMEILHSKSLYWGKDLEELMKKLNISHESDDLKDIITFFEDIFKVAEN